MGLRATLRRRRGPLLASLAVLAVFAIALVLWVGNLSDPAAPHHSRAGASGPSASPSRSPSKGVTSAAAGSGVSADARGLPLPPFSSDISGVAHGTHAVTLRASSDATLLQLAYAVRGGHPASSYLTYVKSPMSITTVAHGDGVVAEIAVQASPTATSISCSVTVDGVTTTRAAKGGYAVVLCMG
jgi:hypothetical protein